MATHRIRDTWVLRKQDYFALVGLYLGMIVVWGAIGWLLVHPLKHSGIVHTDESVSRWFAAHRTPFWNSVTNIGTWMADTYVKIGVTVLMVIIMLIIFKRWLEALMVGVSLALEALAFITLTTAIGRHRPDVPRLDGSALGTSYPSGHTAAAVVYSAIAVVIFWHTRRTWIRWITGIVATLLPIWTGMSRLYRGMHFLTDVIAGALLGAFAVLATAKLLRHAEARWESEHGIAPNDQLVRSQSSVDRSTSFVSSSSAATGSSTEASSGRSSAVAS